jgi:site-specific recombinase XerD
MSSDLVIVFAITPLPFRIIPRSQLLAPAEDFRWLVEIERDLALEIEPKSKFDRLVFSERLLEVGLASIIEGMESEKSDFARANRVRNGLAIALLAVCPIRIKNFAALEIGTTFKAVDGSWWIALPSMATKNHRQDERRVPDGLNPYIELYLSCWRPVLLRSGPGTNALWVSSTTGRRISTKSLGTVITRVTFQSIGVAVSPHLFRTAAASTAVTYGGNTPHLASALLNHADPRVTEEHYNRATSVSASRIYASMTAEFLGEG